MVKYIYLIILNDYVVADVGLLKTTTKFIGGDS